MAEAFVILTSEIQAKSPAISFINSNKGKPLLIADDYTFKLNKATTTTKYWICTIKDCAAKVHTDSNNRLMKSVGNHSHLPEKEKLVVCEIREKITLKKHFLTLNISAYFHTTKHELYYLQFFKILTGNVSCQYYLFDIFPFDIMTANCFMQ
ncbi:unnamed protein product [Rotaria magnacalcarata]|uniref:FLYWCH-type domain-containing protein n=2 Tax=Rotaria magnacalcarata TaxID=392030 RepID=A0A819I200_9BILA|nr:unnamed protein product [Rotaria magnacalcarata]CAF2090580.1 unnamed protein product [Rotaria magnacalcarata]CAF3905226.1 unnamed protein product [Rotaria magnacalcarata]